MKRLLLDGFEVDLNEDIPIPITYAISDIKKPQGRKQSVSKQSVLIGTANNMRYLQSIYSLSLTSEYNNFLFDPTRRVEAKLYDDDDLVFEGFFKIDEVVIQDKVYKFKFTLYSDVISFFKDLSQIYMTDLDFSEYDHTLTNVVMSKSWDTRVIKNGVNTINFTAGVPDGFGYLYGLVDNGLTRPAYNNFPATHLYPQFYFKEVFEKMMAKVGVDFNLTIANEEIYKRIVIGGITGYNVTIDATEINQRKVDADFTNNFTGMYPAPILYGQSYGYRAEFTNTWVLNNLDVISVVSQDLRSQLVNDTPSGKAILINRTGQYHFDLDTTFDYVFNAGSSLTNRNLIGKAVVIRMYVNNVVRAAYNVGSNVTLTDLSVSLDIDTYLYIGDKVTFKTDVYFQASYTYNPADFNRSLELEITDFNNSVVMSAVSSPVSFGDSVMLNAFLPKIKCSDIFITLIKVFNCYFEFDDNGVLQITPFDDFYEGTADAEDWSDKVDYSKPISIKAANLIEGKTYRYKYAKDTDYYNDLYLKETGREYGDKIVDINNPFKKEEVAYELPFAPTVLAQKLGETLILPTIIAVDNGTIKQFKGKPRLYIYSGLRTGSWTLQATTYTSYPQLGHFLNVDNPTFDLNFGLPDKVYYTLGTITNNNLYNLYHSKFFNENTNKDSKQLTASIRLTSKDIRDLNFSKLKNIDGSLFRLNEVKEVDTNADVSFECELIKVIEADSNSTYTGLPSPTPPLSTGSTYRLSKRLVFIDEDTEIVDGTELYIVNPTAADINLSLSMVEKGSTFTIKNISETGVVILIDKDVDGVSNVIIKQGNYMTLMFDGEKYYNIT